MRRLRPGSPPLQKNIPPQNCAAHSPARADGYARIYRDRLYRPVRFKFYHPAKVTPVPTDNEELFYRVDSGEMLSASDMIHLKGLSTDGIVGKSTIAVHRDNLALSVSAQTRGEIFLNQGGNMSAYSNIPRL